MSNPYSQCMFCRMTHHDLDRCSCEAARVSWEAAQSLTHAIHEAELRGARWMYAEVQLLNPCPRTRFCEDYTALKRRCPECPNHDLIPPELVVKEQREKR